MFFGYSDVMNKTIIHLGINIEYALKLKDKHIKGILIDDSGHELSAKEVRSIFYDDMAKGHVIFCGCDNRRADGGCAGHEV